jgi:Na+/phosphate symporter
MPEHTVKEIKKDIYLMLHRSLEMLELTADAFVHGTSSKLTEAMDISAEIHSKEDALTGSLAKLSSTNDDARAILSVPASVEKIASAIEQIIGHTRQKIKENMLFSDKAVQEIKLLFTKTEAVLKKTADAAATGSQATLEAVTKDSDAVVKMAIDFATEHEDRLISGEASPKSSTVFLSILTIFEYLAWNAKEIVKKTAGR